MSSDVWWYYMLELSFYWSLVLSLFMDIKRKVCFVLLFMCVSNVASAFHWRLLSCNVCIYCGRKYQILVTKLEHRYSGWSKFVLNQEGFECGMAGLWHLRGMYLRTSWDYFETNAKAVSRPRPDHCWGQGRGLDIHEAKPSPADS